MEMSVGLTLKSTARDATEFHAAVFIFTWSCLHPDNCSQRILHLSSPLSSLFPWSQNQCSNQNVYSHMKVSSIYHIDNIYNASKEFNWCNLNNWLLLFCSLYSGCIPDYFTTLWKPREPKIIWKDITYTRNQTPRMSARLWGQLSQWPSDVITTWLVAPGPKRTFPISFQFERSSCKKCQNPCKTTCFTIIIWAFQSDNIWKV